MCRWREMAMKLLKKLNGSAGARIVWPAVATEKAVDELSAPRYRSEVTAMRGNIMGGSVRAAACAAAVAGALAGAACRGQGSVPASFKIAEATMCADVDDDRQPLGVTSEFPAGTREVYGWFSWKNAAIGLPVLSRWYYETANIQILTLSVALTRVSDHGAVSLKMPEGKTLPSGSYRLDLSVRGKVVKSVPFTVLAPPAASSAQAPQAPPGQTAGGR
jgi:hypothetical protein